MYFSKISVFSGLWVMVLLTRAKCNSGLNYLFFSFGSQSWNNKCKMKGGSNLPLSFYVTMVVHTVNPTSAHDTCYSVRFKAEGRKKKLLHHVTYVFPLPHVFMVQDIDSWNGFSIIAYSCRNTKNSKKKCRSSLTLVGVTHSYIHT